MMRFVDWILPVMVVIGIIVNAILKGREEAESKSEDRSTKPRGNVELDRFLAEIDRLRREKAGQSPPQPVSAPTLTSPRPVITVEQRPVPQSRPVTSPPAEVAETRRPALIKTVAPIASMRPSRSVSAALSLLKRPQSIASAIILQEMLSPPKSKQRR